MFLKSVNVIVCISSIYGWVKIIHRNRNARVVACLGVSSLLWLPDDCGPMFNMLSFDGILVAEAHDCNMVFFISSLLGWEISYQSGSAGVCFFSGRKDRQVGEFSGLVEYCPSQKGKYWYHCLGSYKEIPVTMAWLCVHLTNTLEAPLATVPVWSRRLKIFTSAWALTDQHLHFKYMCTRMYAHTHVHTYTQYAHMHACIHTHTYI